MIIVFSSAPVRVSNSILNFEIISNTDDNRVSLIIFHLMSPRSGQYFEGHSGCHIGRSWLELALPSLKCWWRGQSWRRCSAVIRAASHGHPLLFQSLICRTRRHSDGCAIFSAKLPDVQERLEQILTVITAFLLSTQLSELATLFTHH